MVGADSDLLREKVRNNLWKNQRKTKNKSVSEFQDAWGWLKKNYAMEKECSERLSEPSSSVFLSFPSLRPVLCVAHKPEKHLWVKQGHNLLRYSTKDVNDSEDSESMDRLHNGGDIFFKKRPVSLTCQVALMLLTVTSSVQENQLWLTMTIVSTACAPRRLVRKHCHGCIGNRPNIRSRRLIKR